MTPRSLVPASPAAAPASRRRPRLLVLVGLTVPLVLAACGGEDEEAAGEEAVAVTAAAPVEQDAGFGAAGHWTAAQLCTLSDLETMRTLYPGIDVVESTGLDEADSAVCLWDDVSIDPLDPESTLFSVAQRPHDGSTFCDCFESFELSGADQAVFAEELYTDRMSGVLVAVGDQSLAVEFVKGTTGAREVAELIAGLWISMQGV